MKIKLTILILLKFGSRRVEDVHPLQPLGEDPRRRARDVLLPPEKGVGHGLRENYKLLFSGATVKRIGSFLLDTA